MSIFAKLKSVLAARELSAAEAYLELVRTVATDESRVSEKQALTVLEATGKTAAQFEADVQLERDKWRWRSEIEAGKLAQVEQQRLGAARSAIQLQYEAEAKSVRDKFEVKFTENEVATNRLSAVVSTGAMAEQRLGAACQTPATAARMSQLIRHWNIARGNHDAVTEDEIRISVSPIEAARLQGEIDQLKREQAATSAA